MSILIKGMEMPKSCSECQLLEGCSDCEGYHNYCMPLGIENGYFDFPSNDLTPIDKRRDDCPLVPVPPHGRLIEGSKVLDIVSAWCPDDDGSVGKVGDLREMLDEIETLPTIIEAEEGET